MAYKFKQSDAVFIATIAGSITAGYRAQYGDGLHAIVSQSDIIWQATELLRQSEEALEVILGNQRYEHFIKNNPPKESVGDNTLIQDAARSALGTGRLDQEAY